MFKAHTTSPTYTADTESDVQFYCGAFGFIFQICSQHAACLWQSTSPMAHKSTMGGKITKKYMESIIKYFIIQSNENYWLNVFVCLFLVFFLTFHPSLYPYKTKRVVSFNTEGMWRSKRHKVLCHHGERHKVWGGIVRGGMGGEREDERWSDISWMDFSVQCTFTCTQHGGVGRSAPVDTSPAYAAHQKSEACSIGGLLLKCPTL